MLKAGICIVVAGSQKLADHDLVDRTLSAIHRKHYIDTLGSGGLPGAEELARLWAVRNHLRQVVTIPGYADERRRVNFRLRNRDILQYLRPKAVVIFPCGHESVPADMLQACRELQYPVWEVPAGWGL